MFVCIYSFIAAIQYAAQHSGMCDGFMHVSVKTVMLWGSIAQGPDVQFHINKLNVALKTQMPVSTNKKLFTKPLIYTLISDQCSSLSAVVKAFTLLWNYSFVWNTRETIKSSPSHSVRSQWLQLFLSSVTSALSLWNHSIIHQIYLISLVLINSPAVCCHFVAPFLNAHE